jgi:hypothetical protein
MVLAQPRPPVVHNDDFTLRNGQSGIVKLGAACDHSDSVIRRAAQRDAITDQHPPEEPGQEAATDLQARLARSVVVAAEEEAARLLRRRRMRVGFGKVHTNARVDSIEVDSTGMRIILKLPVSMRQHTQAITADVMKPKPKVLLRDKSANPATSKSRRKILALNGPKTPVVEPRVDVQPQQAAAATDPATRPIFIDMDNGRVKPFVAAVCTCGYHQEPKSVVFTRKRYYHEMKHGVHELIGKSLFIHTHV